MSGAVLTARGHPRTYGATGSAMTVSPALQGTSPHLRGNPTR